jgi:hypothetical protein
MQANIPGQMIFKNNDNKVTLKILVNSEVDEIKKIISESYYSLEKGSLINKIIATDISNFEIIANSCKRIFNEEENDISEIITEDAGYVYTINLETNEINIIYDYNQRYEELFTGTIESFIKFICKKFKY